jgi:hypothetical protein
MEKALNSIAIQSLFDLRLWFDEVIMVGHCGFIL